MSTEIDITGIDKAAILVALYNNARTQGFGIMQAKNGDMTPAQAKEILDSGQHDFDYLHGRIMKVYLKGDKLWVDLYDRDNGHGAAHRAIAHLLTKPA